MNRVVNLYVDTSSKYFMFDLGKLFASGAKIKILNIEDVNKKIVKKKSSDMLSHLIC